MSDIKNADLITCQKGLRQKYGQDAPSYATLRRWADQGRLISAVRRDPSNSKAKRDIYALAELDRLFLATKQAKKLTQEKYTEIASIREPKQLIEALKATAPTPIDSAALDHINSRLELLFDSFATLLARSDEVSSALAGIQRGQDNLESTRRLLMTKYDAVTSNQSATIEQLRERHKDQSNTIDLERKITILAGKVSQLTDSISLLSDKI